MTKNNNKIDVSAVDGLISNIHKENTDLVKSLEMLANDQFLESKTILKNNKMVCAITMMNWAGQVYDIPFLNEFVRRFSRFRISGDNGIGRQQIIEIAKAIQQAKETENKQLLDILAMKS